ncbi:TadE/TadG family type IV pilus assembly protein [Vibrio rotiferianus]|uniref:TadE/TadG family type IV pilus assembly protein n=1 Tax=Vibrio rotiferianus TaxID=190895 RepID=UPI0003A92926|nr:TadE family protein [Vibrio rotiferianus]ASI95610.1 pilus assembly protein TadE [Vibrio rotiferianus]PIB16416.1 CpaE, associated with Flp pilus assembly [Vibrio rotiferianus CAIM 577 = LMG 21460]
MRTLLSKQKGVTQVEFSIIAVSVLLVIFVILEFAAYFYSTQMVNEVTRRAARLATVCYVADRDDIPSMPAVTNIYPSGFNANNLEITYLDQNGNTVDVSGFLSTPMADSAALDATLTQIKYVKARAINYSFQFVVLSFLINAIGTTPNFETILPAESLGILRPEGSDVITNC